jgi:hypothetical protein
MFPRKLSGKFSGLISFMNNDVFILSIANLNGDGKHLFWIWGKALAKRGGLIGLAKVMD